MYTVVHGAQQTIRGKSARLARIPKCNHEWTRIPEVFGPRRPGRKLSGPDSCSFGFKRAGFAARFPGVIVRPCLKSFLPAFAASVYCFARRVRGESGGIRGFLVPSASQWPPSALRWRRPGLPKCPPAVGSEASGLEREPSLLFLVHPNGRARRGADLSGKWAVSVRSWDTFPGARIAFGFRSDVLGSGCGDSRGARGDSSWRRCDSAKKNSGRTKIFADGRDRPSSWHR